MEKTGKGEQSCSAKLTKLWRSPLELDYEIPGPPLCGNARRMGGGISDGGLKEFFARSEASEEGQSIIRAILEGLDRDLIDEIILQPNELSIYLRPDYDTWKPRIAAIDKAIGREVEHDPGWDGVGTAENGFPGDT